MVGRLCLALMGCCTLALAQQTDQPQQSGKRPEQFAENLLKCAQEGNVPFDICLRMIMEDLR